MNPILVIDDEEMYRRLMGEILRQGGYAVLEAADGAAGLEILRRQPIELVISDVRMDKLGGFELVEQVRSDQALSTIPFIFVTGLSDRMTMRKGMTLGADDILLKPFTGDELLAAVRSRLERQRLAKHNADQKLAQLRSSVNLAMPHEMRTPLMNILGVAEVFTDEQATLTPAELVECGKVLRTAGQRLLHLVGNFVTLTQIEVLASDPAKLAKLNASPSLESGTVVSAVGRAAAEMHGRTADLHMDLPGGAVIMSAEHLTKICEELIDNAFKFSPKGSPVFLSTALCSGELVLTVTDQGRGMTPEQVADLGAYLQFDRDRHEQQGAGLGLSIAKRLAELYGGRIEFVAASGLGLTVRVHLRA